MIIIVGRGGERGKGVIMSSASETGIVVEDIYDRVGKTVADKLA